MNCPHCGEENHSGRTYCLNCGGRLVPLEELKKQKKSNAPRVVAVILVVALLAGGGFFGFRLLKNRGGGPQPGPISKPTDTDAPTSPPVVTIAPVQTSAPTVGPTAQPPGLISTRNALNEVMKRTIREGGTRIDNIALTQSEFTEFLDDFSYYYEQSSYTYNLSGLYNVQFDLTPSRRAWKAVREGSEASLDAEARSLLDRARAAVSGVIAPGMTDYEKELALHDYIIHHCDYMIDVENRHTADARGFFDYGACQCAGYTDTFWLLGTLAGLEVEIISGEALDVDDELSVRFNIEDNGHAWNLVRLDGLWYGLDVTWDDPVGDTPTIRYDYFNLPTAYLAETRTWNPALDPEGAYARSIDDNYYLYRLYNRPEYLAAGADAGLQSAIRQIDARGEAYVSFTDKANIQAEVDSVGDGLAAHYRKTSWHVPEIGPENSVSAHLPFYVYKFYFEN